MFNQDLGLAKLKWMTFLWSLSEAYSEPCQTSKMDRIAEKETFRR